MLLVLMLLIGMLPNGVFAAEEAEGSTTITAYVSVSQNGQFVTGKDGKSVAEIPVTLTGKESYTLDDALKAVHDACYTGGSAAGYASYTHETYGLCLSKLWGDSTGMFGYQINRGTVTVSGLSQTISNGDYIDAYLNQSAYPDNEAYAVFNKSTYKAVVGTQISLKLTQAGYDENWNTVFSACEGAAITVDGVPVTQTVDGEETPVTTNNSGYAYFSISEVGTHIVSATKTKLVGENTVTAITAPVCVVTVTEAPRLGSLNISKEWSDGGNYYELTPAFDPMVTEYSITVPDYTTSVYPYAQLAEGTEGKSYCFYAYNGMFGSLVWSGSNNVNVSKGYFGVVIYDKTNSMSTEDIRYTVNVNKSASLKALTVDGVGSLAFNRETDKGYHYYVDSTKDGVDITATGYKTAYTITIGGNAAANGEAYHLSYDWDENGKMEVPITVSGDGAAAYTYTIELEKEPQNDAPYILVQPTGADYILGNTTAALSVKASANGELAYQWYSNTAASSEGGTAIEGATGASYTPSSEAVSTTYYYCVITNTGKTENNTTTSDIVCVTVDPDPTPKAVITNPGAKLDGDYQWDTGYTYTVGQDATPLTVTATSDAEGGTWSYRWYKIKDIPYGTPSTSTATGTNTAASYTPSTAQSIANSTGNYYGCKVSYKFKGKTYSSWATTGSTYTEGEGESAQTYDVLGVYVFVEVEEAAAPSITKDPVSAAYIEGDSMTKLSVTASKADGGDLSYQWYVNDTNSTEGGTAIEGANANTYELGTAAEGGTKYYYCVVTNTIQGYTAAATSGAAEITVKTMEELVGDLLSGSGTETDPFLIQNAQDYQDVYDLVAAGISFKGMYLQQTADITLPEGWKPIGTSNTLRFSGTIDAAKNEDGTECYTLTVPEGGLPLLGYVHYAEVRNLNIYGTKIAGYGLVDNFVGIGLSGSGIVIDHVTLKSGSSTLKSGLIGTYITTNGFAGCSAGYVATIRNCTIEEGVVIGYNKDQSMIGSIAGRINGTIDNCVSYATVYGTSYVGGILGTRDNAMGAYSVTNCKFCGTVEADGEQVGGIVGGGYCNSTAPNGAKVNIENCSSSGTITGSDKVGGIIGSDTYVMQLWGAHTLKNNSFTGTVKATSGTYVGGIIGFYGSLNKYDDIAGNYYSSACGTDKGIGFVQYVDTNNAAHETESGTTYVNTEFDSADITGFSKTGLNRTDDPLGADAAKLCYTDTNTDPVATELKISGEYKTEYTTGEELDLTGIVLTVVYNDGSEETIALSDATVSGYDANKVGEQEVTISYNGLSASITVTIKNPVGTIDVALSILGDSVHDSDTDGNVHTLTGGNLTTWIEETTYTVDSNATVWDVLQLAFAANGITCEYSDDNAYNTVYISSVTYNGVTLGEFTNGAGSGWQYTLNDIHPELSAAEQYLEDGDVIIFHYSDDYTQEVDKVDNIDVNVTISNAGNVVMAQQSVSVADRNGDGKFDVDEVLYAAHEAGCTGGAAEGYSSYTGDYGLSLGKLWGNDSGLFGYWLNNGSCWSLADEVEDGDYVVAFVYSQSDWSDKYARFGQFTYAADSSLTVTLEKSGYDDDWNTVFTALSGATITVYDADGNAVDSSKYAVKDNGDGTYTITFIEDGKYTLIATETTTPIVPAVCTVSAAAGRTDADWESIYKTTGDYLDALEEQYGISVGSIGGEWMVIGLARSGREVDDAYYEAVVEYVRGNIDENERLHKAKSTDNSRVILALTAMGYDVTDVDGHNLLEGLDEMSYLNKQGINGPIWALIALDSHDYEPMGDVTREKLITCILDAQLADGGWALSGDKADADMTGMALQALAPYCSDNADVKAAVDKALAKLSEMQNEDGSFGALQTDGSCVPTSESTAQVIVALTALGIDPETDSRFVKNGNSPVDALCGYAVDGGGFKHVSGGERNGMATEQGYYALTAYARLLSGKTALYDMSDVKITVTSTEPEQTTNPFTDVTEDKYYYDAVLWAVENGITTGKTDTTFDPNGDCTRKYVVTYLWRAAGCPEPASMENPFTDVKSDRFEKAILWAYYEGITTGTGDGTTFSPEDACTLKQIVTFLWRSMGEPEAQIAENPFTDVKADRFQTAILWAYENGITNGKTATTFQPETICTRSQIVAFLYRAQAEA